MRIRDVILAHIAVQPIIEVKVFVVHGHKYGRHHTGHRNGPFWVWFIFHINDFFPFPFPGFGLPKVDNVGTESGTAEPMCAVGIMQKLYFQWDQTVFAKIHRLDRHPFFKIPDM